LIFPETSHFGLVTKPKHAKSGLCSRRIDLRKRLNLIDVGVKSTSRTEPGSLEDGTGEGAKKKKKPAAGPGLNSGQVSQGRGLPAVRGRGKLTGGDETRRPVSEYYPAPDMEDEDGTEPSEYAEDEYEEKAVKATVPKNPLCLW